MRIVQLTSVHPAFDVRIYHKECKTLAASGYDVFLVAPNEQSQNFDNVRLYAIRRAPNRKIRFLTAGITVFLRALSLNGRIYHFHDPELIPIGILLKLSGKKVVYDVHEDISKQILSWEPGFLTESSRQLQRSGNTFPQERPS